MINRQGSPSLSGYAGDLSLFTVAKTARLSKTKPGSFRNWRRKPPQARQGRIFKHSREAGQTQFA
jgi:hypothetical protein